MDWGEHYPAFMDESAQGEPSTLKRLKQDVEIVDIGCGFGGLLMALAPRMPDKLMLGESLHSQHRHDFLPSV